MTAAGARLDNTQTTFHSTQWKSGRSTRAELREQRFDLRDDLRRISTHRRLQRCGRVRVQPAVGMRLTAGVAGFVGLETCGSVWVCPPCSARIMLKRGLELAAGVDGWLGGGGRVMFGTSTARHHGGHQLPDSLAAVLYAWRAVTTGRYWTGEREELGMLGLTRALEILHNARNGWHPHLHTLLFVGGHVDQAAADQFQASTFRRFVKALQRKGFDALPVGQHMEVVTHETAGQALARYLVKAPDAKRSAGEALGYEMTAAQSKSGRSIGRTQWELAHAAVDGSSADRLLWNNFEHATFRKRQLTWSNGLRDSLRLGAEESDEAIAAEVLGTEADTVGSITGDGWTELCKHPGLAATLLTILEDKGWGAVTLALNGFGIDYHTREQLSYE